MEKNRKISPTNLFKPAVDFEHKVITKNKLYRLIAQTLSFLMIYSYALSSENFEPKSSKVNFNLLCDLDCYSPHAYDMRNRKYNALRISTKNFICRDRSAQNRQPLQWMDLTEIFGAVFFFKTNKEDPRIFVYSETGNEAMHFWFFVSYRGKISKHF